MVDDLETWTPTPRPVSVAGERLEILPIRAKNLARFARAAAPIQTQLMAGDLQAALALHGDRVIELAAIGAERDPDWVGELYPDELLKLAGVVVEVNADFFARRVLPAARAAAQAITEAVRKASPGDTSSPGSPDAEDTVSRTRSN